jgi:hypothetical protein
MQQNFQRSSVSCHNNEFREPSVQCLGGCKKGAKINYFLETFSTKIAKKNI